MKPRLWLLLLALPCCSQCLGQPGATELCDVPFGVGPEGTVGECEPGAVCLPSALAPCSGNDCCHVFCSITGCSTSNPCLDLSPDQFPDGGLAGCGCDDAGPCLCGADGGNCMRSTCLQVCSDGT